MLDEENSESTVRVQMPAFRGNLYQSKLLMWYLVSGLFSKYFKFELGTEIDEAGKYDDLVLKYKKIISGIERDYFLILQAKHRTRKNKIISHDDIFTDKNVDFGLVKYFNSYVKSKNSKMFINGEIEYAIIFTNAYLNMKGNIPKRHWGEIKNIESIVEEIKVEETSFLSICQIEGGKYYKFKSDIVSPVLKIMILDYEYYKIGQMLYKYLVEKKKILPNDILKHILLSDVMDLKNKTLSKTFLKGHFDNVNATERQKLRGALDQVLKDNHSTIDEIAGMQFNIEDNFKESGHTIQIWPSISDTDVIEFLNKSVFAIEQPDEIKLGTAIFIEIRKQYPKYDTNLIYGYFHEEIQNWMKGEKFCIKISEDIFKSRFISYSDVDIFFKNTIQKFKKMISKGPTSDYDDLIQKYKIHFDDLKMIYILKDLIQFSVNKRILSIVSKHVMISSIKVYTELLKFIKSEEFVYVKLSSSNNSLLNLIFESFEYESTIRLLVIEWDFDEKKLDYWTLKINYIINALQSPYNKKLIIISNREDLLMSNFSNDFCVKTECVEILDDANNLMNLKESSQKYFLNTKVNFQGSSAELCDFVINDELKKGVDGNILTKILKKKDIIIGREIQGLKKNKQDYYIHRKFICQLENDKNIYLLSEIQEGDLCSKNNNLQVIENFESLTDEENSIFENTVKGNKTKNIYLLRKKGEAFVLTFVKEVKIPFLLTDFIDTICNKSGVNLISAIAGMGKSTLLSKLSQDIKNQNPSLWVVKFDLNAVSSKLNEIKIKKSNIQLDTALDLLNHGANHQHTLEKSVFEYKLKSKNVVLCLDGFDEICPSYKYIVLEIIKVLENEAKIEQIWLSTRPYDSILNDMKSYFNNCSKIYKIKPFTKNNQKEHIKKIWEQSIEVNVEYFQQFIVVLSELLDKNIKDEKHEFLGIALHTMLISITFMDIFEKYQKTGNMIISKQLRDELSEMLSLSSLYKKFVQFKYEILSKEKVYLNINIVAGENIVKNSYKIYIEKCKLLALDSLFGEDDLTKLLTKNKLENLKKYKDEINNNGDITGIISQIVDGKPQFIHRTFAEYFAALFFVYNLKKQEKESYFAIEYFFEKMIDEEYYVICGFINSMLIDEPSECAYEYGEVKTEMDRNKLQFVLINNWQNIAEIIIGNGIDMSCISQGITILYQASILEKQKGKQHILNLIFEKMKCDKLTLQRHLLGIHMCTPSPLLSEVVKIILEKCEELKI